MLVAAMLAIVAHCAPEAVAAAARVSEPKVETAAAVNLTTADGGLQQPFARTVRWSGPCTPRIVRLYGDQTLVADSGVAFQPSGSTLFVRSDRIWPADPEPAHPEWEGRRFLGSASLAAGTWRVGAWQRKDGVVDVARYRPDMTAAPIILLSSRRPLLGLFYLGAPDAFGGTLSVAQRLGPGHVRLISMAWSEEGLRSR